MADNPKEDDVKCVCRFCYAFAVFLFVTIDVILDRLQDKNQEYEIEKVVKNISETCKIKLLFAFLNIAKRFWRSWIKCSWHWFHEFFFTSLHYTLNGQPENRPIDGRGTTLYDKNQFRKKMDFRLKRPFEATNLIQWGSKYAQTRLRSDNVIWKASETLTLILYLHVILEMNPIT